MTSQRPAMFELLPAHHRLRDAGQGYPLRALLETLDEELERVDTGIDDLYANWFVETCDTSVVPLIGELMRVRALNETSAGGSERAFVANTIRYRRRKGTAAVVEQLARDVTGWPARVVEFFRLLCWNQHMNHVRPDAAMVPDLRDSAALELTGTAFDPVAHTVDVRRADSTGPRHNISNLGVFFWRLRAYPLAKVLAWSPAPPDGRFSIHRLGQDSPLFHTPRTEVEITHLAEELDVPAALRRRPLYDELEARREAMAAGLTPESEWFLEAPPFAIRIEDEPSAVLPEQIMICDLSGPPLTSAGDWRRPPATKAYALDDGSTVDMPIRVGIDPELGRIAFPAGVQPARVRVDYAYGAAADIGGGPYLRDSSDEEAGSVPPSWSVQVGQGLPDIAGSSAATLETAVQDFLAQPAGTHGRIEIVDSERHDAPTSVIVVLADSSIRIAAAGETWPHIIGGIRIRGGGGENPGELVLEGVLLEGMLEVLPGDLGLLRVQHATIARSVLQTTDAGIEVGAGVAEAERNAALRVEVLSSIVGPIDLAATVRDLRLEACIVDASHGSGPAVAGRGAELRAREVTVFGAVSVRQIDATNALFTAPAQSLRTQVGCLRFSHLPLGSRAPRRYRCEPDLSLASAEEAKGSRLSPAETESIAQGVAPRFVSTELGRPGFALLADMAPAVLLKGAERGGEMGVYAALDAPIRRDNFLRALEEYLRFGLELGVDNAT